MEKLLNDGDSQIYSQRKQDTIIAFDLLRFIACLLPFSCFLCIDVCQMAFLSLHRY